MFEVMGVRKVENTHPQEFEIQVIDKQNTKEGYVFTTYNGTEPEFRIGLKEAGMQELDIDRLFKS